MAGRDGFVAYPLSIPGELRFLIEMYQKHMKITSYNQTLRVLLETHPEIDRLAQEVYADASNLQTGESP